MKVVLSETEVDKLLQLVVKQRAEEPHNLILRNLEYAFIMAMSSQIVDVYLLREPNADCC